MSAPAPAAPVVAAALEARDLAHRYSPRRGLDTVSFSVTAPGAVAVTGVNGSGKSTLLRVIAGLLRPSGGALAVEIGGRAIPHAERRHVVGLASPELSFYDEMTCAENLAFAAEARGLAQPRRAALEALARAELSSRAEDLVTALSSGMKQRLRLAFALLHRPPVLLLDEPGSHLDDAGRDLVSRIVNEQRASGLVLIATNDEREWGLAGERIELRGRGLGDPA